MSNDNNYTHSKRNRNAGTKCGFTRAQILQRKVSSKDNFVTVHCPNVAGHRNGDQNPSGTYNLASDYYQCFACKIEGYANDCDSATWEQHNAKLEAQSRSESDPTAQPVDKPKRKRKREIGADYYRYADNLQVKRIDYSDGSKTFRAQHWDATKSDWINCYKCKHEWKLFNSTLITSETETVYVVEGEKCVHLVMDVIDYPREYAVTSKGGSGNADKADWSILQGRKVVIIPDLDDQGFSYALDVSERLKELNQDCTFIDLRDSDPNAKFGAKYDIEQYLDAGGDFRALKQKPISALDNVGALRQKTLNVDDFLISADKVKAKPVQTIWNGTLYKGEINLIAGAPDTGKTNLALAICADLANDGERVLIACPEDSISKTLKPRLDALDTKLENIEFYTAPLSEDAIIELASKEFGLIYIDNLKTWMAEINTSDEAQVRSRLALFDYFKNHDVAILAGMHFRKQSTGDPISDLAGSGAFAQLPRAIFAVYSIPKSRANKKLKDRELDKDSKHFRVMALVKCNLVEKKFGIHFEICSTPTGIPVAKTGFRVEHDNAWIDYLKPRELSNVEKLAKSTLDKERQQRERFIKALDKVLPKGESMNVTQLRDKLNSGHGIGRRIQDNWIDKFTKRDPDPNDPNGTKYICTRTE